MEDSSEDWWENAIDRLLASPAYGERWARHWLDVAGYADSAGHAEAQFQLAVQAGDLPAPQANRLGWLHRAAAQQHQGASLILARELLASESRRGSELAEIASMLLSAFGAPRSAASTTLASALSRLASAIGDDILHCPVTQAAASSGIPTAQFLYGRRGREVPKS